MIVNCTSCCAEKAKDEGNIPAIQRYLSPRIKKVHQLSTMAKLPLLIFSGKYGLMSSETPIPYYDVILEADQVELMAKKVADEFTANGITQVNWFGADTTQHTDWIPYETTIKQACEIANVRFNAFEVEPVNNFPPRRECLISFSILN